MKIKLDLSIYLSVYYSIRKGEIYMSDLVCKSTDCDNVVTCEEGVSSVTCGYCCATIGTSTCND